MSKKNANFAAGLVAGIDATTAPEGGARQGIGASILAGRESRLAGLATGSVVSRTNELVDPERCRMWGGHNREYGLLDEGRCADLIESIIAQGRQEVPAIVRRLKDDPGFDYEVICGARRHWAISWLRTHNYPQFRFLIDVRSLTDEEAFRLADLENRARDDLSDIERARDYLRALDAYYDGRQKAMAERINVTESWLSRYLDLGRLPQKLMAAFIQPHDLKIKHVTAIKPLLKPDDRRDRVFAEAARLAEIQKNAGSRMAVPEIIRALTTAADAIHKAAPKRSGKPETILSKDGNLLLKVESVARNRVKITLLPQAGGTRREVEAALKTLLDRHWT